MNTTLRFSLVEDEEGKLQINCGSKKGNPIDMTLDIGGQKVQLMGVMTSNYKHNPNGFQTNASFSIMSDQTGLTADSEYTVVFHGEAKEVEFFLP